MKKFIKKNKKIIIIAFIIGIICICGTAFTSYQYLASQVIYKDGKTVEQALNELYNKNISIVATGNEVASGTTLNVEKGQIIIVSSIYTITATNSIELSSDLRGGVFNNVASFEKAFITNDNTVTITIRGDYNFSYIILQ